MDARQARDHRPRRRDGAPNRRARVLVLAALIALVAAGCGSDSDDGGSAGGGGDSGGGETTPATELTITYWPQGKVGSSHETTLTCDPAGGTHPRPEKACELLASDPDALDPVPPNTACTLLYGGPQEATIVGTIDGERVNAAFNRSGGCEIDRWDRMEDVLQVGD